MASIFNTYRPYSKNGDDYLKIDVVDRDTMRVKASHTLILHGTEHELNAGRFKMFSPRCRENEVAVDMDIYTINYVMEQCLDFVADNATAMWSFMLDIGVKYTDAKLPFSYRAVFYFENEDASMCYPLDYHITNAKSNGIEEIELIEAIPDNYNKDYVWCTEVENVVEKRECNKTCSYYQKSKSYICELRGKLHEYGESIRFNTETSQPVLQ